MGHYRIPKQPAIAPVLNQINLLYAIPAYLFNTLRTGDADLRF